MLSSRDVGICIGISIASCAILEIIYLIYVYMRKREQKRIETAALTDLELQIKRDAEVAQGTNVPPAFYGTGKYPPAAILAAP
ncbi:hypothetical protein BC829DRAFT_491966 [Chytridium lagenaria]|nr:hypothetical protein BC829DRAFT_491966 [Chytridium lagenaria]